MNNQKKEDKKMAKATNGINFRDLKAAAEDLNKVLDLEPAIATKVGTRKADLETEIKKVSRLIEPTDKGQFKAITETVFAAMKIELPWENGEKEEKTKTMIKNKNRNKTKEVDEFGFRIGSRKNIFAEKIKKSKKGLTMAEVKAAAWSGYQTQYGAWKKIMASGKGVIDKNKKMTITS